MSVKLNQNKEESNNVIPFLAVSYENISIMQKEKYIII